MSTHTTLQSFLSRKVKFFRMCQHFFAFNSQKLTRIRMNVNQTRETSVQITPNGKCFFHTGGIRQTKSQYFLHRFECQPLKWNDIFQNAFSTMFAPSGSFLLPDSDTAISFSSYKLYTLTIIRSDDIPG